MKRYTLHSISPFSLFKFGFFIGLIVSFLPLLVVILFLLNLANKLLEWLGNLVTNPTISLPIIGEIPLDINILQLLGLQDFYTRLESFIAIGALQALILTIFLTLATATFIAVLTLMGGLAFNLISAVTGGLQVTLSEKALRTTTQTAIPVAGSLPSDSKVTNPATPPVQVMQSDASTAKTQKAQVTPVLVQVSSGQDSSESVTMPASAQSYEPRLEIQEPWSFVYPLATAVILIGSDAACQLRLADLQPRHAQISYEDGRYILRDLSLGQSWVQGQTVQGPVYIQDGYFLQFGPYVMNFRL